MSRIYLKTPRLRGLLAFNLTAAAAGAMVIVNTVVLVRTGLGRSNDDVALALAAFGGGSMAAAFLLPRLLDRLSDRPVMLGGSALLVGGLGLAALLMLSAGGLSWTALIGLWIILGLGYSAVLTPGGRLLRRSAAPEDRSAIFAAQFALSHAGWLITYSVAGAVGAALGMGWTFAILGVIAAGGAASAMALWPARDPDDLPHTHPDLAPEHPHLLAHKADGAHHHAFWIDDLHIRWPKQGDERPMGR